MTRTRRFRQALLVAVLAGVMPAWAGNMGSMLKDSPMGYFTDQDMQLFTQTLNDVLDKGADGEARRWSNPSTKAGGEIKAIKSFQRDAAPCRRLAISNSARGLSASGRYNFCQQPTGQWAPAK